MTRILRNSIVVPVLVAMICAVFAVSQGERASAAPAGVSMSSHHGSGAAKVKKKPYRVKQGWTLNSPYGSGSTQWKILNKIYSAIDHAHKGAVVRVFSWNIFTWSAVNTILDAQKRGVRVKVIMDKGNLSNRNNGPQWRNPYFRKLRSGIKSWNRAHPKRPHSHTRLCRKSCRGKGGDAHSKYVLITKSGASKYVYMETSSNLTGAAATRQWNDMYTLVGHKYLFRFAKRIFEQAMKDKRVKHPWASYTTNKGHYIAAFSPTTPRSRKHDRLLANLRKVKCRGANKGAGNRNGRTIIRAAPDVMRGDRGMAVARQLRRLWDNGCDVKIGYTVMGYKQTKLLHASTGRGAVPRAHMVDDLNGDGEFDRYFHLKAYTINGHIGKNRHAYWMQIGSGNTADLALWSDENYLYIRGKRAPVLRYQNHINYWFGRFPHYYRPYRTPLMRARIASGQMVDPYAHVDMD